MTPQDELIPVIDLFAGPGGLGEGFASLGDHSTGRAFRLALSVEMDEHAHKTLELRALYRRFTDLNRPQDYYDYIRRPSAAARHTLFGAHPVEAQAAQNEAWRHRLSEDTAALATGKVCRALGEASDWVLIGGPPCQAYSLVGRSRRANDRTFAGDEKHTLYRHYLRIIEDFRPPVFLMENVKGMLSARLGEESAIDRVLRDLRSAGDGYSIYSFTNQVIDPDMLAPADYLIRAEEHGIPQARHRVILLGVRKGWPVQPRPLSKASTTPCVQAILGDLPPLRSRISSRGAQIRDSDDAWAQVLTEALQFIRESDGATRAEANRQVSKAIELLGRRNRAPRSRLPVELRGWFLRDKKCTRTLNHEPRSHMPDDLTRYLFASSFAAAHGYSPKLSDFPTRILPAHRNVNAGVQASHFSDRFRVQLADRPSSTITSHISKDGHYYIHYDPSQCRSLSVREAARLQTFPDDYFFEGNRTQQYHQVGNAVPPLLARQLAGVVIELFGAVESLSVV